MIDLYCERIGPGLWGEPANVTSNLAFVLAAWAVWRLRDDSAVSRSLVWRFTTLLAAVAAGSALFHMLATPWARIFDEGPIVLLQIAFIWSYCRRVMRLQTPTVFVIVTGLLTASVAARVALAGMLNNSLPYAPALALTMALGIDHARARRRGRWLLVAGSALFVLAVSLRSIDNVVCASFPLGTHVFWHLLAALVVYLFIRGLLTNIRRQPQW